MWHKLSHAKRDEATVNKHKNIMYLVLEVHLLNVVFNIYF
jgi:hypothetical protein